LAPLNVHLGQAQPSVTVYNFYFPIELRIKRPGVYLKKCHLPRGLGVCCSWNYFHQTFYSQETNGALNTVAIVLDILGLCSFVFKFF